MKTTIHIETALPSGARIRVDGTFEDVTDSDLGDLVTLLTACLRPGQIRGPEPAPEAT